MSLPVQPASATSAKSLPAFPPCLFSPSTPSRVTAPPQPTTTVSAANPPGSWASLLYPSSHFSIKLPTFTPTYIKGVAQKPDQIVDSGIRLWSELVVGFNIGKRN